MKKQFDFFDKPGNVKLILRVFYISLVLLILLDFFITKHPDYYWETAPGFFAAYGFMSYVVLIYVSRLLRWLVKRDEKYYDWVPKRNGGVDQPHSEIERER